MRCDRAPLSTTAGILLLAAFLLTLHPSGARAEETRASTLGAARAWAYQLQKADPAALAQLPHDVLVIDYSRHGDQAGAFTAAEIARLRRKPDGSRRIVLAYMSVGEAETYRYYWHWTWGGTWYGDLLGLVLAPSWLGPENEEWGGNYAVRYWQKGWQDIILGQGGYLDRIVAAGFDGVYLDKIDSCLEAIAKGRASARDDMRTFVRRIAERGRAQSPGFLVMPQNGEELLDDAAYVAMIDGLGKEDLLYGEFKERTANPQQVIARRVAMLAPLKAAAKPILAVEYVNDPAAIAQARQVLEAHGYVPLFADRDLGRVRNGDLPAADTPRPVEKPRRRKFIFW